MPRIAEYLMRRFQDNKTARDHFGDLLSAYEASGLAPPNLAGEIASGEDGKLYAHLWEAMIYRHLSHCGFAFTQGRVTKSGQRGPDFGITYYDQPIWIEAVVPSPEGIPQEWLDPPKRGDFRTKTMPHEQMLLRWTSALKDKRDKLRRYAETGVIAPTDCTIIAVNSCRLADFVFDDHGISQMPFALEAVFPIGPIAVPISIDGKIAGEAARAPRYSIRKANNANVPTANFLDAGYANVGAVIGAFQRDMLDGKLNLTVVHNPLANHSVPIGILGATKEFVADEEDDHYLVHPVT
jgi:hypothetical protein